jgi:hypothetical protein
MTRPEFMAARGTAGTAVGLASGLRRDVQGGAPVDSTFIIFKFLHIAMMFGAVAAAVIPEVVLHIVANSRDARAIATMAGIAERIGKVTPVFFVGGAVFGLLAAWAGQLDFTAPWLLATYVLFVLAMVTGILFSDPWVGRLKNAAVATGDGATAELQAVIDEPGAKIASAWLMSTIVAIIFLMVVKPGN